MAPDHHGVYHPKDAIAETTKTALITGGFGALFAGIQNTLTRQNVGPLGFFTRFGGTTTVFAAMGASYAFTKNVSANLREKNDSWNTAIGGFFGGSMVGLSARTLPAVLGYGTALAVLAGVFDYTGGAFTGSTHDPTVDEVARKEYLRKNKRRPIQETIAELGEGRGIYGPGYEERRRERLKENYGIDVSASSAH